MKRAKTPAGSFGARPCWSMRRRLFAHGREALPPSFAASNWIVARIRATVPWADFKAIRDVYREADRLTVQTGVKHHVDHIIPLTHPRVCGLHVADNLRPIPAGPNMSKNNYWCPEQMELFDGPEQLRLL
jgi:hypothetical protein